MSFNWLLIWTVTISCAFTFFSLLRLRVLSLIHYLPVLLVFATLLFFYQRDKDYAGYFALVVWFVLLLLPGLTSHLSNHFVSTKRYLAAKIMAWIAWGIHPWGGTRDQPLLVKAISKLDHGENESATNLLEALRVRNSPAGRTAVVILTKLRGQWSEFLRSILNSRNPRKLLSDPLLANIYLQSLGETGQTERLVADFNRLFSGRNAPGSGVTLNLARLKVAAFCGRSDLVAILLDGPLGHLDLNARRFWLATAMQAAGRDEPAARIFSELLECKDRQIAIATQRRLELPVRGPFEIPSSAITQTLVDIEQSVAHENRFVLINSIATIRPVATQILLVSLVVMFFAEMFNGATGRIAWESSSLSVVEKAQLLLQNTTSNENLIDMGAVVLPASLYPDPLWRVYRAAFLHFGLLHLLMNMAGLWIFGQRLEEAWGSVLTAIAYLTCAIFSIYLMTVLPLGVTAENSTVLAGASGGVMGLIGCVVGYLAWGKLLQRNRLVNKEFNLLFLIVVGQTIFDQSTPEVSGECHLLGLIIGVTIGFSVGVCGSIRNKFQLNRSRNRASLAIK